MAVYGRPMAIELLKTLPLNKSFQVRDLERKPSATYLLDWEAKGLIERVGTKDHRTIWKATNRLIKKMEAKRNGI
jgi:hypothetical protein